MQRPPVHWQTSKLVCSLIASTNNAKKWAVQQSKINLSDLRFCQFPATSSCHKYNNKFNLYDFKKQRQRTRLTPSTGTWPRRHWLVESMVRSEIEPLSEVVQWASSQLKCWKTAQPALSQIWGLDKTWGQPQDKIKSDTTRPKKNCGNEQMRKTSSSSVLKRSKDCQKVNQWRLNIRKSDNNTKKRVVKNWWWHLISPHRSKDKTSFALDPISRIDSEHASTCNERRIETKLWCHKNNSWNAAVEMQLLFEESKQKKRKTLTCEMKKQEWQFPNLCVFKI